MDSPQGDVVEVRFRRRLDYVAAGLTYEVESNTDLINGTWSTVGTTMVGNPAPTGDGVTEVVTLQVSLQAVTHQFFRMAVSRN